MNQKHFERKTLSSAEVEMQYGIAAGSLANLRWSRKGPRFYKVGRRVLYFVEDIESWICRNPNETLDSFPSSEK